MRSRLLLSTLAAVAVAIVLLGVPLAAFAKYALETQALDELQRRAENLLAAVVQQDPEAVDELLPQLTSGELRLVFLRMDGGELSTTLDSNAAAPPPGFDADLQSALATGDPGRAYRHGTLAVTVPYERGRVTYLLRTLQDDTVLVTRIRAFHFMTASLALTALAAATVAALWQGRRFAKPIQELAASARRLGDGDFSARAPRSGLPEPDEVATALDSTASRLAAMLERSRSFNADASHQLRTPLTALRLDLEALEQTSADPALVAAAVAEADRLEATIDELLTLAREPRGGEEVDLAALATERLDAWQSLARAEGREVVLRTAPVPLVHARPAALGQSLQVLLDNALAHGAGTITVSVAEITGGVRLCVADEGPGIPEDVAQRIAPGAADRSPDGRLPLSGGRGLALARTLVEAEGGRLSVEPRGPGATVCLLIPLDRVLPAAVPAARPAPATWELPGKVRTT